MLRAKSACTRHQAGCSWSPPRVRSSTWHGDSTVALDHKAKEFNKQLAKFANGRSQQKPPALQVRISRDYAVLGMTNGP